MKRKTQAGAAAVPAWERDGREMRSLPSFTRGQAGRSSSSARGEKGMATTTRTRTPTRKQGEDRHPADITAMSTSDRSSTTATTAANSSVADGSPRGSVAANTTAAASEADAACSAAGSRQTPKPTRPAGGKSSVWLGARLRPTVAFETPSLSVKCDVVDATVWVTPPSVRHATPIPHPADAVFGPSSSQADVNTEMCVETVPLAFGGGSAAVICVGGARAGKTSALFAPPGEIPDIFTTPVVTAATSASHDAASVVKAPRNASTAASRSSSVGGPTPAVLDPAARLGQTAAGGMRDTHSGGLVGAFFADVVKRVAGLAVYDIEVTCGMLQVVATPAGDRVQDILDPSSTVGVKETSPDRPELVGFHEEEIITPHDFAKVWARVRARKEARDAPPTGLRGHHGGAASTGGDSSGASIATICVATVRRTDSRNGAVSTGRVLFAELQPPEHSKQASLTHAALTKVLCSVGGVDPAAADPTRVFVPWRDSKFTRVLQCVFAGPGAYTTPRLLLLSMLSPAEDAVQETLACAGVMAHVAKNRRGRKGHDHEGNVAEVKETARRLQSRLDHLAQSTHTQWVDAQEEILRLRREVALLKARPRSIAVAPGGSLDTSTGDAAPAIPAAGDDDDAAATAAAAARMAAVKGRSSSGGANPQAKGALALAKILQVLTRNKVVRPEAGSGTVAVLGQLISQLVTREQALHASGVPAEGVTVFDGGVWCEVLRELREVEPTVVPSEDPRSAAHPFGLSDSVADFFNWYEGVGLGDAPPPMLPQPRRAPPGPLTHSAPASPSHAAPRAHPPQQRQHASRSPRVDTAGGVAGSAGSVGGTPPPLPRGGSQGSQYASGATTPTLTPTKKGPPQAAAASSSAAAKEEAFRREVAWLKRKAQDAGGAGAKPRPGRGSASPAGRAKAKAGRGSPSPKGRAAGVTQPPPPPPPPQVAQRPAKPQGPPPGVQVPAPQAAAAPAAAPADPLANRLTHELESVVGVLDAMQTEQLDKERTAAEHEEQQRSLLLLQLHNQQRQQQQQQLLEEQEARLRSLQRQLQQHSSHLSGTRSASSTPTATSSPAPAPQQQAPQPTTTPSAKADGVVSPQTAQRTPGGRRGEHNEELEWSLSPDNMTDCQSNASPRPAPRALVGSGPALEHAAARYGGCTFSDNGSPTTLQKLAEGLSPSPAPSRVASRGASLPETRLATGGGDALVPAPASVASAPARGADDASDVWRQPDVRSASHSAISAPAPSLAHPPSLQPGPASYASAAAPPRPHPQPQQPRFQSRFARPKCP